MSHDLQASQVNIIGVALAVSHIDLSGNLTVLHTIHHLRLSLEIWVDDSLTTQSWLPASLLHQYLVRDTEVCHELHKLPGFLELCVTASVIWASEHSDSSHWETIFSVLFTSET